MNTFVEAHAAASRGATGVAAQPAAHDAVRFPARPPVVALALAIALHAMLLVAPTRDSAGPATTIASTLQVRMQHRSVAYVDAGITRPQQATPRAPYTLPAHTPTASETPVAPATPSPETGIAPVEMPVDAAALPPANRNNAPVLAAHVDTGYLDNPAPVYPLISRRLGEAGKVILRVHVGAAGEVIDIAVEHSSGHARLDDAARRAVSRWRFVPAQRGGEAIESTVLVPMSFALDT